MAARPFVLEVEKRLRLVRGPMTQASATMMVDAGWRKAGESIMRAMWLRVKRGETNDGNKAAKVTEQYGKWRHRKYRVSPAKVFIASGQLYASLHPTHSNVASIKMVRK